LGVASRITVDAPRIGLFDPLKVPSAPIRPTAAPRLPQGLGRIYLCILLFLLISFFTAPHAPNLNTQHLYTHAHPHTCAHARMRLHVRAHWTCGVLTFGADPKRPLAAAYFLPQTRFLVVGREVGRISSKVVKSGKGAF
jgi:hypothetical protein